jgi:hypothetical protein
MNTLARILARVIICVVACLLVCNTRVTAQIRSLRGDGLAVYYWPGTERLAARVIEQIRAAPPLPALPRDTTTARPIRIYLAPDAARFDSLTGGGAPDWGAGVALPDSDIIVMPLRQPKRGAFEEMGTTLRHEIAHIRLHRYLSPVRIPRWFDEGYATWASGSLDWESAWLLRLAFVRQQAPSLDSLALEWPEGATDARVAYLLSASAVQFLVDQSGERGLRVFLENWKSSGSFDDALGRTYGMTAGIFERDWRRAVRARYGWAVILSNTLVLWGIIGLLIVVLYVVRRKRDRKRYQRLLDTELPDDPAYWLEQEQIEAGPEVSSEEGKEPPKAGGEDRSASH